MKKLPFQGDFLSRLAVVLLISLLLLGFVGPRLPVGDPTAIAFGPRLAPPGPDWLMGTDNLGRTLLPRVLQGIRITFVLATTPVLFTAILAIVIGMLAGYLGGWFDELVARLADVLFSFPSLLLGLILVAIMGPRSAGHYGCHHLDYLATHGTSRASDDFVPCQPRLCRCLPSKWRLACSSAIGASLTEHRRRRSRPGDVYHFGVDAHRERPQFSWYRRATP